MYACQLCNLFQQSMNELLSRNIPNKLANLFFISLLLRLSNYTLTWWRNFFSYFRCHSSLQLIFSSYDYYLWFQFYGFKLKNECYLKGEEDPLSFNDRIVTLIKDVFDQCRLWSNRKATELVTIPCFSDCMQSNLVMPEHPIKRLPSVNFLTSIFSNANSK